MAGAIDLTRWAANRAVLVLLLSGDQIMALRSDHGIYMAGSADQIVAWLTMGTSTSSSRA
ncbi:MAG: hypothetical protein R3E03_03255 [Novosphingobium sp.]